MMNARQFYDWQTSGGADDVLRLVDCLERAGVEWCAIGGVAVNHWAAKPMVTRDIDLVVALNHVDVAVAMLEAAGFASERFPWSVNLTGRSAVSVQITTEDFYCDFPRRAVAADVHGILMRVASIEDTLAGKIKAWSEPSRQQSKQAKDFTDIVRLVESHSRLWDRLPAALQALVREDRRTVGEDIKTAQLGWPLGMPLIRKLGNGLWEVRSHIRTGIARVMFTVEGSTMVLLHGFQKKSQRTPLADLMTAKRRLSQLQSE